MGKAGLAEFGRLADGRVVEAATLANRRGMRVTLLSYGASVQSVIVPDRDGRFADVALGHPSLDAYVAQPQYMGATCGRVANRIARGRFTLDGRDHRVPANNGPNALHGGPAGFDKAVWEVAGAGADFVVFRLVSPDGDQGFPGELTATARYSLDESNTLAVAYEATAGRTTLVNLTNHAYWNLAGEGAAESAMDHLLHIPAEHYLPTDEGAIPTGELRPVAGTAFDFRDPTPVGARVRDAADEQVRIGRGYDHNWVIARERSQEPRLLARVEAPRSGRVLEVWSNQPGLQFYSGNFLDATSAGKSGRLYRQGDALVLEPQMFPDTPNRPEFGSLRVDPGETYRNVIEFRFPAPRPA
jgi:aldose 1-epimerase